MCVSVCAVLVVDRVAFDRSNGSRQGDGRAKGKDRAASRVICVHICTSQLAGNAQPPGKIVCSANDPPHGHYDPTSAVRVGFGARSALESID